MKRWAALLLCLVATPAAAQTGAELFAQNCAACHQLTGKGIAGAFPALAGDPFVVGPREQVISVLLKGRGGMPRFGDQLSAAEIASVISYVRGAWGNAAPPVTATEVATLRGGKDPAKAAAAQAH